MKIIYNRFKNKKKVQKTISPFLIKIGKDLKLNDRKDDFDL